MEGEIRGTAVEIERQCITIMKNMQLPSTLLDDEAHARAHLFFGQTVEVNGSGIDCLNGILKRCSP